MARQHRTFRSASGSGPIAATKTIAPWPRCDWGAERDRVDTHSVVEGLPTAAVIVEASITLEEPSKNQILVVRDDTWLYLHRGYLLPEQRLQGIGSAMLSWAEERIRQLVNQHGRGGRQ